MSDRDENIKRRTKLAEIITGHLSPLAKLDAIDALIDQVSTRRAAEAHMQGWHEGRAAANNPELKYSYTTGLQPTKGSKDE